MYVQVIVDNYKSVRGSYGVIRRVNSCAGRCKGESVSE